MVHLAFPVAKSHLPLHCILGYHALRHIIAVRNWSVDAIDFEIELMITSWMEETGIYM